MKNALKKFLSNKNMVWLVAVLTILLGFHIYQYIDSGYTVNPLIRIVMFSIAIPCIVFIGENSLPYLMFAFAMSLTQMMTFSNYTAFVLVFMAGVMKRKFKYPMIVLYAVAVVVVCIRHDKDEVHLIMHYLNCSVLYSFMSIIDGFVRKSTVLNLTEDEKYILEEIVFNEKKLKEIDGHKQNTVSKKLKVCRDRNNCLNNSELYERYRQMKVVDSPQIEE